MTALLAIAAGLVAARLIGRCSRPWWAMWAAGCSAYCAVLALRTGSFVGRAAWVAFGVPYVLEVRRIVRAWRLIPARDSVTR